ncbi:MAG TPA: hypothetical protein VGS21_03680, partial [Acidimicrobiales bacterium]|nr:hypothetical protein [Acidimicrobiales bacterium]
MDTKTEELPRSDRTRQAPADQLLRRTGGIAGVASATLAVGAVVAACGAGVFQGTPSGSGSPVRDAVPFVASLHGGAAPEASGSMGAHSPDGKGGFLPGPIGVDSKPPSQVT